ncbi:alpha/beta hydrolase [Candidatus Collierbacteria bacterium]|nr:alpha/beta hydrolase [Candidatus Collierbacteria bacterium]
MQTVINGVLTNYEAVNPKAKSHVVILHGWRQNASLWLPVAKLLSEDHCYYLLDLPGFGGTKNLAANSNVPEYTTFVRDFTDKLKLKNFVLLGHSFGGQVACDFALKYPKLVSRLVLVDAAVIRHETPTTTLIKSLAKLFKPISQILPISLINQIHEKIAHDYSHSNDYQKSVLRQIINYDLSSELHLIKVPTEIVWGSEDKVIPYVGKYLVENISDARLHVIYGCGHSPHLTHPQKLADILCKIL